MSVCVCEGFQDADLGEIQELMTPTGGMNRRRALPIQCQVLREEMEGAAPGDKLTLDNMEEAF